MSDIPIATPRPRIRHISLWERACPRWRQTRRDRFQPRYIRPTFDVLNRFQGPRHSVLRPNGSSALRRYLRVRHAQPTRHRSSVPYEPDSKKLNEAADRALDFHFPSNADIKAPPRTSSRLFSVDPEATAETLAVFWSRRWRRSLTCGEEDCFH